MKYFKNKKVFVISLTILAVLSVTIIAAKSNANKYKSKDMNMSANLLLGMSEKPLVAEEKNDNPLIFNTNEEMISFYSKVFMVNYDIVNNKINELIKKDEISFEKKYILNDIKYSSKEEAILKTIDDISKNPGKYNLSNISTNKYELSDYKPEELVYKFATILDVNPNIALAIAYCECGYKLNSYNFVKKHNIGGIRGNKGFVRFKNEAYGIYKYILMLHNGYKVTSESGTDKIISMSKRYCGGSQHWINTVTNYYNDLKNNGFEHYYNKSNHDRNLEIPYL